MSVAQVQSGPSEDARDPGGPRAQGEYGGHPKPSAPHPGATSKNERQERQKNVGIV